MKEISAVSLESEGPTNICYKVSVGELQTEKKYIYMYFFSKSADNHKQYVKENVFMDTQFKRTLNQKASEQ